MPWGSQLHALRPAPDRHGLWPLGQGSQQSVRRLLGRLLAVHPQKTIPLQNACTPGCGTGPHGHGRGQLAAVGDLEAVILLFAVAELHVELQMRLLRVEYAFLAVDLQQQRPHFQQRQEFVAALSGGLGTSNLHETITGRDAAPRGLAIRLHDANGWLPLLPLDLEFKTLHTLLKVSVQPEDGKFLAGITATDGKCLPRAGALGRW
mmetsp:Transcript_127519/g.354998  ORF Transcript_127519/g.354998 Transcript_127519/m.354998 type:complete len:206 (-) Transcript_127519:65-682(-)